jgi:hypothetical protein
MGIKQASPPKVAALSARFALKVASQPLVAIAPSKIVAVCITWVEKVYNWGGKEWHNARLIRSESDFTL